MAPEQEIYFHSLSIRLQATSGSKILAEEGDRSSLCSNGSSLTDQIKRKVEN